MKLFFSPGACSMAPHICLEESKQSYLIEKVNLKDKTYSGGDYTKINPKGQVPALETKSGTYLTEAAVVMEYIADQAPDSRLMPSKETAEYYKVREWMNFISTELHKGIGILYKVDRMISNPEGLSQFKQAVVENLGKNLDYLSKTLDKNKFLMGSQFTTADAYLFTILGWTKPLKIDISKYTTITSYLERVAARPAVQAVLRAEGILK